MTVDGVNPFAALVTAVTQDAPPPPRPGRLAPGQRPLELLLQLLDEQPGGISTEGLRCASGLPSRLVWGLLKGPRQRGQVHYSAGQWALNREYQFSAQLAQGLQALGLAGAARRLRALDDALVATLPQAQRRAVAAWLRQVAGHISWEGQPCGH